MNVANAVRSAPLRRRNAVAMLSHLACALHCGATPCRHTARQMVYSRLRALRKLDLRGMPPFLKVSRVAENGMPPFLNFLRAAVAARRPTARVAEAVVQGRHASVSVREARRRGARAAPPGQPAYVSREAKKHIQAFVHTA